MGKTRSQRKKGSLVEDFPSEILLHILSYLEVKDLLSLAKVSHFWKTLSEDQSIWSIKCLEERIFFPIHNQFNSYKSLYCFYFPKIRQIRNGGVEVKWFSSAAHELHIGLVKSGSSLISMTRENINVWDPTKHILKYSFPCPDMDENPRRRRPITFRNGKVVTNSDNKSMIIFNTISKRIVQKFGPHKERVRCIDWTDSETIVSSSSNTSLYLWDVRTATPLNTWIDNESNTKFLCLEKDNISNSYRVGRDDGIVSRFDFRVKSAFVGIDYSVIEKFNNSPLFHSRWTPSSSITGMKLCKDYYLFTIDHLWLQKGDSKTGQWETEFFHHPTQESWNGILREIRQIKCDNRFVFMGTQDGYLQIWDVKQQTYLYSLQISRHYSDLLSLSIDDQESCVAVSSSVGGFGLCEFNGSAASLNYIPVSGPAYLRMRKIIE